VSVSVIDGQLPLQLPLLLFFFARTIPRVKTAAFHPSLFYPAPSAAARLEPGGFRGELARCAGFQAASWHPIAHGTHLSAALMHSDRAW